MNNELYHHGVKGQKWGIRRTAAQLGHVIKSKFTKKKKNVIDGEKKKTDTQSKSKTISDLTDDEINARIKRLELEKKYSELLKSTVPPAKTVGKGRKFVMDIVETSAKNIGTQLATYAMGTLVNKITNGDIVNPKKGQKDK